MMRRWQLKACLFGFGLLLLAAPTIAAEPKTHEALVYAKRGDRELKLDLALPKSGKLRPAVLCIHGGGWGSGSRDWYKGLIRGLAKEGFVAASMSYRFIQDEPWPAQKEDVVAGLAWLREHSEEYGIDPERIAALGHSAGGHLSLVLGTLADTEKGERSPVQAVVNYFGPVDILGNGYPKGPSRVLDALVGGPRAERIDISKDASPLYQVTRGDAPVITFQGTADRLVPVIQSKALHASLKKALVPSQLEILEGAGHGWRGERREKTNALALKFLDDYLKGSELPLIFSEDFDDGAKRWKPTDASAWKPVKDEHGTHFALHKKKNNYKPPVRSPVNHAVLDGVQVTDFSLDVSARSTHTPYGHQDLCLFFGYQDPSHFYYVHFGRAADAHANSIFLVDGKARVSIAQKRTTGTDWSRGWHRLRVKRDVASGVIEVFFDDMTEPVMRTVDKTFTWGQIGIGSFDDIGDFDAIRLRGKARESESKD